MIVSIIGSNGMLSVAFAKFFTSIDCNIVDVYGLEVPNNYECSHFYKIDLLKNKLDYDRLLLSDVIVYASGSGVQAAVKTDSSLMYSLNVSIPIEITLELKKRNYKGVYISFGSYMEIGLNDEIDKDFNEEEVVCSNLPVTNDYALSKRLYSRYMNDFFSNFTYYHFILPNMFSEDDLKPGTRLVPYTLQYLKDYKQGSVNSSPNFSSGIQKRQFITLEEMVYTVYNAIHCKIPSGLYNIGGGEYLSIRNLIERLFSIYNVPCKDSFFGKEARRDGDIKSLKLNADKLSKVSDVLPQKTIEDIFQIK